MNIPFFSSLFKAKTREAGLLAVGLVEHGVYLVQVVFTGTLPAITRCEFHQCGSPTAEELNRLAQEANLGKYVCGSLLSPGDYQMMMVDAPNVPPEELKNSVRWKIKDSLSYHIDSATVDVLLIPPSKYGSDRAQSMYAITAHNDLIQRRMELFSEGGLELSVIDIPEMAQRNIATLFEQPDRALALLAFDDNGGLLTFTSGGELYLSRRIEINITQLSDANENLREQYRDRVELELQRSLDYFDRQFNHLALSRVLLCAPDNSGLLAFLISSVDVTVEKLDLSQVMDISLAPTLANTEFLAQVLPTLGAALRQEVRAA